MTSFLVSAQAKDEKHNVYMAYFDEIELFSYDSLYKKKIDKVAIAPLSKDSLEFDSHYLKDYLAGEIAKNETFIKYVRHRNISALDWLDLWPRDLGKMIFKDREMGEMLSALDSVIRMDRRTPDFAAVDKRFVIFDSADVIYKMGWKKFYKNQKKSFGLVEVSDIVFSNEGNRAAFYIETRREGLNGGGSVVFMKKMLSGWKIDSYLQFWIS